MNPTPEETIYERYLIEGKESASIPLLIGIVAAENPDGVATIVENAKVLMTRRGLDSLRDLSRADLEEIGVTDPFRIQQCLAAFELARRISLVNRGQKTRIDRAEDIYKLFRDLDGEPKEYFCALYLDSKNNVLSRKTIHIGTINMSIVGPREVFREAVREGAASFAVVHNHPSGDPTPSPEDMDVTEKLVQVGVLLDIPLIDHIIIGHNKYTSFKKLKLL